MPMSSIFAHSSIALLLWLILALAFFLTIQWMGYLCRWKPATLDNRVLLRPRALLITGTITFWLCSLVLLRFYTSEAWTYEHPTFLCCLIFASFPVFLLGKKLAVFMFKGKDKSTLQRLTWTYCLVGLLLALGAPLLPVIVFLGNGSVTILSEIPIVMTFIACTVLPCGIGIMSGIDVLRIRQTV